MALTPVGQFQTVVNVNGNERINTTQADDQTYNITESLGADIQVNGTTEGSFSQTSDSTYNVNISSLTTSDSDTDWFADGAKRTIASIGTPFHIQKVDYYLGVNQTFPSGSGFGSIFVSGEEEVDINTGDFDEDSGTITDFKAGTNPTGTVKVESDGSVDYDITVYIGGDYGIETSISQS